MAQWDVYPNPLARAREDVPYLVVVQSDLLDRMATRLVVPLARNLESEGGLPPRMAPLFEVAGQTLRLKPQEAGALLSRSLRKPVASLRSQSHRIVSAIDTVISGV